MKSFLISLCFLTVFSMFGQTPCTNGTAGAYPCNGYDLQSFISLEQMDATEGNDSWGWTDPQTGKEYAIVGLNNGTAFIDISNPTAPIYVGKLITTNGFLDSGQSWRYKGVSGPCFCCE